MKQEYKDLMEIKSIILSEPIPVKQRPHRNKSLNISDWAIAIKLYNLQK